MNYWLVQVCKFCDLVIMEASYIFTADRYFAGNDGQASIKLPQSKMCGRKGFLPEAVIESWLQYKKSKSKDAKSREKLLTKKYRL
jgi:hypothetical protein